MKEVKQTDDKGLKLSSPNSVYLESLESKKFSLKKARRILGKLANGVPDGQIQADIDTAILLKDIFFDSIKSKSKTTFSPSS